MATERYVEKPPLSLRMYLCFVIGVTTFEACRVANVYDLTFTMPYTGWTISFPYMASIFFVVVAIKGGNHGQAIRAVRSFLVYAVLLGLFDFVLSSNRNDHGNPYLRMSQWRPVFTVFVPCLWLAVLSRKSVSSYCLRELESPG